MKGLLAAKLPAWLDALGVRMARDTRVFGVDSDGNAVKLPNHVLVNAYRPGDGIMVGDACACLSSSSCAHMPVSAKGFRNPWGSSHDDDEEVSALTRPRQVDAVTGT